MDISEIAQAALIMDGYFWNSTSRSHNGWIFLKHWRCKGHEKCERIKKVWKNQILMTKKIKIFTFAYRQCQGGRTLYVMMLPSQRVSLYHKSLSMLFWSYPIICHHRGTMLRRVVALLHCYLLGQSSPKKAFERLSVSLNRKDCLVCRNVETCNLPALQ